MQDHRPLEKDAVLQAGPGRSVPFFDLFYQGDGIKSGMHHPDGFLWIRGPDRQHQGSQEKVPLRAVAPTVLAMFGLTAPSYMTVPPLT